MFFRKNGYICVIEKDEHEPMQYYIERGYYVCDQKPHNKREYDKAVRNSRIMINIKYLGASYSKEVMDEI